jgi:hypothetical protein
MARMMSHIDAWATLAAMAGLTPPPHGEWKGNDGKPIYFDSIDNSAYILGKAQHSARTSWIYIDGETFQGARADIGGDLKEPWLRIAWKYQRPRASESPQKTTAGEPFSKHLASKDSDHELRELVRAAGALRRAGHRPTHAGIGYVRLVEGMTNLVAAPVPSGVANKPLDGKRRARVSRARL